MAIWKGENNISTSEKHDWRLFQNGDKPNIGLRGIHQLDKNRLSPSSLPERNEYHSLATPVVILFIRSPTCGILPLMREKKIRNLRKVL